MSMLPVMSIVYVQVAYLWNGNEKLKAKWTKNWKRKEAERSETTSVSFRFRAGRKVGNTMNRKDWKNCFFCSLKQAKRKRNGSCFRLISPESERKFKAKPAHPMTKLMMSAHFYTLGSIKALALSNFKTKVHKG
jgi:hypothetical protein